MIDSQTIYVDGRNGRPQRTVAVYSGGAEIHRDFFNTDDAFRLQQFSKAARQRATGNDDGWQELFDAIRHEADAKDKAALESLDKPITYQRYTCRELDAEEFVIAYLVAWILVQGQPCIVAGGKKTLKTNLLIALAIALATGESFLGKFKVDRAVRVLMMSGESGMATIQETARRIATSMGLELANIGNLIFSPDLPRIGHLLHHDALEKMLLEDEIEVLILDPVYLCLEADGNESSLFAMGSLLRSISELCQRCGVTLILAHHTKKTINDPFAPPELEHIAWSGFSEFARQWILVGRREQYEPGSGSHRLWMNVGGSAGHSSCWALDVDEGAFDGGKTPRHWSVNLMRAEEARKDAEQRKESAKAEKVSEKHKTRIEGAVRRLVQAAAKYPSGETKRTLFDTAGLKNDLGNLALAAAIDAGAVIPCDVMKGNWKTPREGYKLRPDDEETDQCAQCAVSSAPTR